MGDLRQRPFGPAGKPLAALSDQELHELAVRRRAARASGRATGHRATGQTNPAPAATSPRHPPGRETALGKHPQAAPPAQRLPTQVRQWYANLEVPEGSSVETVEAAYARLMRRYDPDRHRGDPDKHRAALDLTRSLTHAYRGLSAHLRQDEAPPTPRR
jgi:DnaJ-domain-containing protein 1